MSNSASYEFAFDTSGIKAYSGYYNDKDKLFASASGGAATAISEKIIEMNGVVFGVCYTDDFKGAVFAKAETKAELEKFRSSKYIYAEKKIFDGNQWVPVYPEVEKVLASGRKVLFIGLGCDVTALLKTLQKHQADTSGLYTIDLICHGPTYAEVQKAYVEDLEQKFSAKIVRFSVRYKKRGWEPPYIHAEFENGKVFEEQFYESDFGYAFKYYSRTSCYHCQCKGAAHCADVTVGDFWGCTKKHPAYHPMGVSIMFTKSAKGEELIGLLRADSFFTVSETDKNFALAKNTNYYQLRKHNPERHETFGKDFQEHGLHYATVNSSAYRLYKTEKYRKFIKSLIPKKLLAKIKKK